MGVHYPHDVLAGFLVGALVAATAATIVRRHGPALTTRLGAGPLRPLLTAR
ncbi:hypothetical protein ACWGH1_11620 [Streptomyces sp. NPDC054883]